MGEIVAVEIVALVVSAVHAYEGRPLDGPRPDPEPVKRAEIEVRAGLGIVGDRYFNQPVHRKAAVTIFDAAALDGFAGVPDPALTRRNIIIRGYPVDQLAVRRTASGERVAGRSFSLDSGSGAVRFQAQRPANPCAWMDVVLGAGAFKGLRGRGGVRCEALGSGVLRVGPAELIVG
ncbi:molybdenum cofactor biosysynthesis protein [Kribbella sp. CA-293567]|uniref:molybdenum cofactor biosysynthesis protein n=1 Tax=Kribbella sp. CA-293567 TaxID=3002436 RepID=UPI0022DDB4E9|nr:molybdenum cofactor biosysynthesis protein [Kribbella sp. CA-293567]WBQ04310.1 molybdenum cofactor biosysynthesis protein [Kribbella sp. CA-293567]